MCGVVLLLCLQHMRNIIARCLQKNPNDRPTATELLQDKFFKVGPYDTVAHQGMFVRCAALGSAAHHSVFGGMTIYRGELLQDKLFRTG